MKKKRTNCIFDFSLIEVVRNSILDPETMIANSLSSIYNDPKPSDNDVIIDLKTGEVHSATGGII